jgi:2TM domain
MATKKVVSKKKAPVAKKTVTKTVAKPSPIKQSVTLPKAEVRLVKEKAQDLKQLFSHAVVYIAVNAFLIFVNFATSPDRLWFFWVLIGWGIGLAFHWLDVMNYTPFNESKMEAEAKKILKK